MDGCGEQLFRGYIVQQSDPFVTTVACPSAASAVRLGLVLQVGLLAAQWEDLAEERDAIGNILFRGPRLRCYTPPGPPQLATLMPLMMMLFHAEASVLPYSPRSPPAQRTSSAFRSSGAELKCTRRSWRALLDLCLCADMAHADVAGG